MCLCRWPDNWSNTELPWILDWVEAHAAHAVYLGKPLILQEWGVHLGEHRSLTEHYNKYHLQQVQGRRRLDSLSQAC